MNIEKGKLFDFQLALLIFCFGQGALVVPSLLPGIIKNDIGLAVAAGFLVSLPFILSYVALAHNFPGKSLKMKGFVYGPYWGQFISWLYLGYFLIMLSLNLSDLADFYVYFITPLMKIAILFYVCVLSIAQITCSDYHPFGVVPMGFSLPLLTLLISQLLRYAKPAGGDYK